MSHTNRVSPAAFTLIELLVVISIIAVLMGLIFPAATGAIESTKKAQAKNDLVGICNAVRNYSTEYGKFPDLGAAPGEDTTVSVTNGDLIKILVGKDDTKNPRKIVFIEPPAPKTVGSTTLGGAKGPDWHFFDHWGSPYWIRFDTNYDNDLDNPYDPNTGAGPGLLRTQVIALSLGKNKLGGSGNKKSAESTDDVISWQ